MISINSAALLPFPSRKPQSLLKSPLSIQLRSFSRSCFRSIHQQIDEERNQLVQKIKPSIAHIAGVDRGNLVNQSHGTGFVLTNDGLLITSAHLVCEKQFRGKFKLLEVLLVSLGGKRTSNCLNLVPLAVNTKTDLAILRLPADVVENGVNSLKISLDPPCVGDSVMSIGNPESGEYTTRFSHVQYVDRVPYSYLSHPDDDEFPPGFTLLETALLTGGGFSGAPVVNLRRGEVIGVHMSSFTDVGFDSLEVPSRYVLQIVDWYRKNAAGGKLLFMTMSSNGRMPEIHFEISTIIFFCLLEFFLVLCDGYIW